MPVHYPSSARAPMMWPEQAPSSMTWKFCWFLDFNPSSGQQEEKYLGEKEQQGRGQSQVSMVDDLESSDAMVPSCIQQVFIEHVLWPGP